MAVRNVSRRKSYCVLRACLCKGAVSQKFLSWMIVNELMRLLTEIGSCRIIGGGGLECWFMSSSSSCGFLYGLYVPFGKSKVMSRKLVLSWLT